MRAELTKHVGGAPTFPQRMLIEQTAIIGLQLALSAEEVASGEVLTRHDHSQMIAWQNAFRRNLVELGLLEAAATAAKPPSVADYWRQKTAGDEAA